ncbi:cytoplasmic protein [Cryptococcus deuterogattii LA55]|nr:cytoplasmic protein [Cryptococcus deuterogattii LA55]KIR35698.1 cytoplasmic protein [Cryptococcus deuterogattii MMRL2647]KIR72746.1 cytoplasmic protein [Cryptococcus deuterogattii CA1014]KIR95073.1 cytoplasmic protein [Cryptococcus deuterogattii CBS 10090]KIS00405.1 cytoplasmic protein [Cryptococcus deuterogattii 2001/935-1]
MPPRKPQTLQSLLPPILSLLPNTYSAHQKALTTTARLLHASPPEYGLAIEILFAVAKELLKTGEAGSGSELGVRMLTVMGEAGIEVNESSRANVTQLLALTPATGPWRKKLVDSAVKWTQAHGECPCGDPHLQQYIGEMYYREGQYFLAEQHLLASGKRDASIVLADMMFDLNLLFPNRCGKGALDPGPFALRGILPPLLHSPPSIVPAFTFLTTFLAHLTSPSSVFHASLASSIPSQTSFSLPEIIVTASQSLNFAQLALVTIQHAPAKGVSGVHAGGTDGGIAREWKALCARYSKTSPVVAQPEVQEALSQIATEVFLIPRPRSSSNNDLLQNLMGSLFGGGR